MAHLLSCLAIILISLVLVPELWAKAPKPKAKGGSPAFTVCTVTINSDDEKKVFQKRLGTKHFKFVELVPSEDEDSSDSNESHDSDRESWFDVACKKNIQCDILLISGHFAGKFFGEKEAELSLETLEKASCSQKCKGLLSNPREVFLFGCNTLAGKEKDARTPEQYRQVLLEDNIPEDVANRVVQARYGDFGESNRERMKRVFAGIPHLYGFDSVGPSGKNVKGFLESYFKRKGDYAAYLSQQEVARITTGVEELNRAFKKPQQNLLLAQALGSTSFTQCSGLLPDDPQYAVLRDTCRIYDESLPVSGRLKSIQNLLTRDNPLPYLPAVESFFENHPPTSYSDQDRSVMDGLKKAIAPKKASLLALLNTATETSLKIELAVLAYHLGWISEQEHKARVKDVVKELVSFPFKPEKFDLLCSLRKSTVQSAALKISDLPPEVFTDTGWAGRYLVRCLESRDQEIQKKTLEKWTDGSWLPWEIENFDRDKLAQWLGDYTAKDSQSFLRFGAVIDFIASKKLFHYPQELAPALIKCLQATTGVPGEWSSWKSNAARDCASVYGKQWKDSKNVEAAEKLLPFITDQNSGTWVVSGITNIGAWSETIRTSIETALPKLRQPTTEYAAKILLAKHAPDSLVLKRMLEFDLKAQTLEMSGAVNRRLAIEMIKEHRLKSLYGAAAEYVNDSDPNVAATAREIRALSQMTQ